MTRRKKNKSSRPTRQIIHTKDSAGRVDVPPITAETPTRTWIHVLLLVAVSFAVYGSTLRNGFVTDDNTQILMNSRVKDSKNLAELFKGDVWAFANSKSAHLGVSNYYRPLQMLVYAGEYALFGENPVGWHAVNVTLNAAVAVSVYFLVAALAGSGLAFWAALIFALHPMHTEAVAWVAAVPELQCGLFMILAMTLYHRARSGGAVVANIAISSLAFLAAVLSKETALLFPIILLSYEYFYRKEQFLGLWKSLRWIWPYLLVLVIYASARMLALGAFVPVYQTARQPLSAIQLFLAIPPILARYVGKLIVPIGMNYFYAFAIPKTFGLSTIVGFAVLATLVAAMFLLRRNQPLLAFALAWFLLTLAPAMNFNHIGENFFTERYLYIPSLGFSVLAAWGLLFLRDNLYPGLAPWLAWAAGGAALAFYAIQIERRIPQFHDNLTLLSDTVRKSPESAEVLIQYASAMFENGDVDGAIREGARSLELRPNDELTLLKMAQFQSAAKNYDGAIGKLEQAIALHPEYEIAWINLAKAYTEKGDWAQAADCYRRLEEIDYKNSGSYRQLEELAMANQQAGDVERKMIAVKNDPRNAAALLQLSDALARFGKWPEAASTLREATELSPGSVEVWTKLGISLGQTADKTGAIDAFNHALMIDSNFLLARKYLADALAASGRIDESITQLETILVRNPRYEHADSVYYSMGLNFEKKGDRAKAVRDFEQALVLNPHLADAQAHLRSLQRSTEQNDPKQ